MNTNQNNIAYYALNVTTQEQYNTALEESKKAGLYTAMLSGFPNSIEEGEMFCVVYGLPVNANIPLPIIIDGFNKEDDDNTDVQYFDTIEEFLSVVKPMAVEKVKDLSEEEISNAKNFLEIVSQLHG